VRAPDGGCACGVVVGCAGGNVNAGSELCAGSDGNAGGNVNAGSDGNAWPGGGGGGLCVVLAGWGAG
jgi:hypothetical protein